VTSAWLCGPAAGAPGLAVVLGIEDAVAPLECDAGWEAVLNDEPQPARVKDPGGRGDGQDNRTLHDRRTFQIMIRRTGRQNDAGCGDGRGSRPPDAELRKRGSGRTGAQLGCARRGGAGPRGGRDRGEVGRLGGSLRSDGRGQGRQAAGVVYSAADGRRARGRPRRPTNRHLEHGRPLLGWLLRRRPRLNRHQAPLDAAPASGVAAAAGWCPPSTDIDIKVGPVGAAVIGMGRTCIAHSPTSAATVTTASTAARTTGSRIRTAADWLTEAVLPDSLCNLAWSAPPTSR